MKKETQNIVKKVGKNIPVFFMILIFFNIAYSQEEKLSFEKISSENRGLKNVFTEIYQDSKGFMWFGSENSIMRFDGYKVKVFEGKLTNNNSISGNVYSITEDKHGFIWIGAYMKLLQYDRKLNTFSCYSEKENINYQINDLFADAGYIYIATDKGIYRFNPATKKNKLLKFNTNPKFNTTKFSDIFNENDSILWLSTVDGLIKYNLKSGNHIIFTSHPKNKNSLLNNECKVCKKISNDLWIGHNNGISILNPKNNSFKRISSAGKDSLQSVPIKITDIIQGQKGFVYIGTINRGLYLYNPANNKFHQYTNNPDIMNSLSNDRVKCLYKDKSGVLWIGTIGGGVNKIFTDKKKFHTLKHSKNKENSLANNQVHGITEDKEQNIWFTTLGGLSKYDPKNQVFYNYKNIGKTDKHILDLMNWSIITDKSGNIWIGSNSGLSMYNPNKSNFTHYQHIPLKNSISNNHIYIIFEDSKGNIWTGTKNGLNKLNPKTQFFVNYYHEPNKNSLSNNIIWRINEDHEGFLWFATSKGLNKLNPATNKFTHYLYEPGNFNSLFTDVNEIFISNDNTMWIGTHGFGLLRFNKKQEKFTHFGKKSGLSSNNIFSILEDDSGILWMGTNNGISRFNPKTLEVKNYKAEQGLQGNEFNFGKLKSSSGLFYFGGTDGINYFYPDSIKEHSHIPNVVITGLKIKNKQVNPEDTINGRQLLKYTIDETDEIILIFKDKNVTFEFAALHYALPEKNQYKYKLEGFDDEWNNNKNLRFATYTNLPPGEYKFLVKASNFDDVWNENPTELKIIVRPPFWKTWWFRSGVFAIFLFLTYSIYKIRIRAIKEQNKILEQKVDTRTKHLYDLNTRLEEKQTDLEVKQEEITTQRDFAEKQKKFIEKQNKELEKHRNKLNQLVRERTSELEIALEKAKESDRLKSVFLSNMSHEVRTPMNAIIGFSGLLNDPELTEDNREELVARIEHNTNTLLHLIEDIIDIAKIEAGELEIYKKDCQINKILNELHVEYKEKIKLIYNKALEIKLSLGTKDKEFKIHTDTVRLEQILSNLIDNAIKFTEKGLIEFGYTLGKDKNDQNIVFFIKDTGIGLSKEQQKNIFQRFTKIEENRKKLHRGAGLGLAISQNIVELLGGKIWIDSTPNKGSTFYFSIPITELTTNDNNMKTMNEVGSYNWGKKTILVAEDEDSNFNLVELILRNTNAKIIRALNGNEVLEIFQKENSIDLILMDIKMPDMDGLEATKRIRKFDAEIPIIAHTAYAMADDEKLSLKSGCNNYISKPIKKEKLMEILNKYLT